MSSQFHLTRLSFTLITNRRLYIHESVSPGSFTVKTVDNRSTTFDFEQSMQTRVMDGIEYELRYLDDDFIEDVENNIYYPTLEMFTALESFESFNIQCEVGDDFKIDRIIETTAHFASVDSDITIDVNIPSEIINIEFI